MTQDISLWSPVVLASLASPRVCQRESRFGTDHLFKRLDDIKLKLKNPRTEWQGKALEARLHLEIIALLEDQAGYTQLISRQEIIRERIAPGDFDQSIESINDAVFVIQVQELKWDGEMQGNELVLRYSIKYMILAVQEQVVKLYSDEEVQYNSNGDQGDSSSPEIEIANQLALEIDRVRNDNEKLNRKLFLYERDLMSLQRGIKKAESRNVALSSELSGARELVEKLRTAITRKDLQICTYENPPSEAKKVLPFPGLSNEEFKLGQKIKRILMNNL